MNLMLEFKKTNISTLMIKVSIGLRLIIRFSHSRVKQIFALGDGGLNQYIGLNEISDKKN